MIIGPVTHDIPRGSRTLDPILTEFAKFWSMHGQNASEPKSMVRTEVPGNFSVSMVAKFLGYH